MKASLILSRKGFSSSRLDAEVILASLLKKERPYLYAHMDELLTGKALKFMDLIYKRAEGTPVAYIIGEKEFYGRRFIVTPDVLIPRPETEVLIEKSLQLVEGLSSPINILDLGTGSGAIAITLLLEIDSSQATAVDISADALRVADRNSILYGLKDRLHLFQGDLGQRLSAEEKYNVIVSNPPYISVNDYEYLPLDVKFEPRQALIANENGFEFYHRILDFLPRQMDEQAVVVFEVGWNQANEVGRLCLQSTLFNEVGFETDLAGIKRVVWAIRG